jgi:hypothetical protein
MTHFWKLMGLRSVDVLVTIQPKVECFRYEDSSAGRRKLAEDCYNRVLGRISGTDSEDDDDATGETPPRLLSS